MEFTLMKKVPIVPGFLLLICILFSADDAHPRGWALVVGIDEYNDTRITPLAGAVNDAVSLAKTFEGVLGIDRDQLFVLTSDAAPSALPTTGNIITKLSYIAEKARPEDLFIMAFSGHGTSQGGKTYLWTYLSESSAIGMTALRLEKVKEKVKHIKADRMLLILDICRKEPEKNKAGSSEYRLSGDFVRGFGEIGTELVKENRDKVIATLFSCEIGQRSYEWPAKQRGFFSYFLEQGLKGEAIDDSGRITLAGLQRYLKTTVSNRVMAELGAGKRQRPWVEMTGSDPGAWVLNQGRAGILAEELGRKQKEKKRLMGLEMAQKAARKRETEEEKRYMAKIAGLDAEMQAMRDRLGTSGAQSGDSLDAMLAMVHNKEDQQKRLEKLRKKREAEEAKRQAEIERLKVEERKKRVAALKEDIKKYERIISSPFGKDMKGSAWKTLTARYPEAAKGIEIGDTEGLLIQASGGLADYIGMKFTYIPPGTFMMGSPKNERGHEQDEELHQVTLTKGFHMGVTEVTQRQWRKIMGSNPSNFKNCGDDCPVESVSWKDVREFIRRLNKREGTDKYRLPTEAEWEYAARAGSTTAFGNGDIVVTDCGHEPNLDRMGWYCGNAGDKTHPVAGKARNAWGLYDMHGNVYEWCQDWYDDYPDGSVSDPEGPKRGSDRVIRGGSWNDYARDCRSAYRVRLNPGGRDSNVGFRLARTY